MSEMDAIIKEFVSESTENLDQLDLDLVQLEQNPSSPEILGRVFRTVHSIKGATGFLGFTRLGELAHTGEGLLSLLRDGKLAFNPEIAGALLSLVDDFRKMLSEIGTNGQEDTADYSGLIETINKLQKNTYAAAPQNGAIHGNSSAAEKRTDQSLAAPDERPVKRETETQSDKGSHDGGPDSSGESSTAGAEPAAPKANFLASGPSANDSHPQPVEHSSVRVDIRKLDALMDLVGELVLIRNQVLQPHWHHQDPVALATAQRLNLITTELQDEMAKTRLQPIANVWQKFPRLVRDLAIECGKQVRFSMEGNETELDKTILETIKDPLTHLVRNAVDHGIETPEVRLHAGKSAEGSLRLRAFHESGLVIVEISDDGGGIDVERVREKAIDQNLVSSEASHLMSEAEILNLIFLPGFSTAKNVTAVSGRGVGMDVVKTNVEQINGTVEIQNRKGSGTSFRICIPLTLAIIPALMVTAANRKYAIPQTNVIELLGLRDLELKHQIEPVRDITFCRLRGRLLQLISLSTVLAEDSSLQGAPQIRPDSGRTTVVVVHSQDSQFGLIVDEVTDNQEIVVKPAGKHLKEAGIYAGATIVGNGSVALILDVRSLARLVSPVTDSSTADSLKAEILEETPAQELEQLLLLECPNKERVAIPLSEVVRLEEFAPSEIEAVGEQEAVQYLDSVLPLIRLADLISENPPRKNAEVLDRAPAGNIRVVVCSKNNSSFGLIVDRMLDIVEHRVAAVQSPVSLFGFAGMVTAVIQGRVTRLLDLKRLIQLARVPSHLDLAVKV